MFRISEILTSAFTGATIFIIIIIIIIIVLCEIKLPQIFSKIQDRFFQVYLKSLRYFHLLPTVFGCLIVHPALAFLISFLFYCRHRCLIVELPGPANQWRDSTRHSHDPGESNANSCVSSTEFKASHWFTDNNVSFNSQDYQ